MTPSRSRATRQNKEVSARSQAILVSLVRAYIECGEPISSLWLARHGGFGVSSATVRSALAELEQFGYITRPHTSSGRVPTDLGYRCYVDLLLRDRRKIRRPQQVQTRLRHGTIEDVLTSVSYELSRVSHVLGFALTTPNENSAFQHIDFVRLESTRILVVLVSATGYISHRIVNLNENVAVEHLEQAANYLNVEFAGLSLAKVRKGIANHFEEEQARPNSATTLALRLARVAFTNMTPSNALFVQGVSLLLNNVVEGDDRISMPTLQVLFEFIEEKKQLVKLLKRYVDGQGLTIIIGAEHSLPDFQNFSLIASTYFDGNQTGCVGVLGPRRMHYSQNIAAVDSVSRSVSRLLVPIQRGTAAN